MKRLSAVVPKREYERVEKLIRAGAAKSVADLVRQAVGKYMDELGMSIVSSHCDINKNFEKKPRNGHIHERADRRNMGFFRMGR